MKAPAFQFYPKDFLCDVHVMSMSLEEVGAYWRLVSLCWLERGLPAAPEALARLLQLSPARFSKLWPAIAPCFTVDDAGRLQHPRLELERAKQERFRETQRAKGVKSGKARRRGGDDEGGESSGSPVSPVQPNMNPGSTGVQPEGNSPISYLHTPVKERVHTRGAMGSSYLAQSATFWSHDRGYTLTRSPRVEDFLKRLNMTAEAFCSWLTARVDEQPADWVTGNFFKFIDEQIEAHFGSASRKPVPARARFAPSWTMGPYDFWSDECAAIHSELCPHADAHYTKRDRECQELHGGECKSGAEHVERCQMDGDVPARKAVTA